MILCIFHTKVKKKSTMPVTNTFLNCHLDVLKLIHPKRICKLILVQNIVLWTRTNLAVGTFKMKMTCHIQRGAFETKAVFIWNRWQCLEVNQGILHRSIWATQIKSITQSQLLSVFKWRVQTPPFWVCKAYKKIHYRGSSNNLLSSTIYFVKRRNNLHYSE